MSTIDHREEAFNKILSQYRDSLRLIGTVNTVMDISQDIEDQGSALFDEFNLDLAVGADLDHIGSVLGLPRFPVQFEAIFMQWDLTGWDTVPFGDLPFIEFELIDDERYRCVLKSWGIVLNSIGSVNNLILSLSALFCIAPADIILTTPTPFQWDVTPFDSTFAFDGGYDTVAIFVNKTLDIEDLYLYNYIAPNGSRLWAKLAGVQYILTSLP
jgi:hypothetical protein